MSATRPSRLETTVRILIASLVMSAGSLAALAIALPTLFLARRWYAAIATALARVVLRILRVRLVVSPRAFPAGQVVYVSNHPSTLDLFILVALGLPRTRFFLSGFLRWWGPLGLMASLMGTFFTVPQDRPDDRRRIFMRAERVLRRTGESVYLSPEGGRTPGGVIGPFNKGAFHLATALRTPIVPLFFDIPAHVDPGMGYSVGAGTVVVHVKAPIETREWRVQDVELHRDQIRAQFVAWNENTRVEIRHAD